MNQSPYMPLTENISAFIRQHEHLTEREIRKLLSEKRSILRKRVERLQTHHKETGVTSDALGYILSNNFISHDGKLRDVKDMVEYSNKKTDRFKYDNNNDRQKQFKRNLLKDLYYIEHYLTLQTSTVKGLKATIKSRKDVFLRHATDPTARKFLTQLDYKSTVKFLNIHWRFYNRLVEKMGDSKLIDSDKIVQAIMSVPNINEILNLMMKAVKNPQDEEKILDKLITDYYQDIVDNRKSIQQSREASAKASKEELTKYFPNNVKRRFEELNIPLTDVFGF